MNKHRLWHTFTHTGRVEDYLRYRGIDLSPRATDSIQEEIGNGNSSKTASNDRRSHSAEL